MLSLPTLYRRLAPLCLLPAFLVPGSPLRAQEADPAAPQPPARTKCAASKSSNVMSGTISALDATAETLTLKERTGKTAIYVLTPKTHYTKNKHPVQLSEFKVGDAAVLHFRKSRTDGALLVTELDDPASWTWLTDVRKNTTLAVIKEITEDTLSVTVGAENVPLDYTISDKTRWEKAGKEVASDAFKPSEKVYIVPRSLPSGNIMARAVADTTTGAAQEKERSATSVHATILLVDPPAHKLSVKTVTGDTRSLAYTDETEVILNSKPVSLSTLKTGLHISARLRHEAGGDEVVWRITIDTGRKAPIRKKATALNADAKTKSTTDPKKATDK
jgi:hypothetical protein